jgi:hypothetical protein
MQTIDHCGFKLEIYAPVSHGERWHVVIRAPSNASPMPMLISASGVEAIKKARAAVDGILDGSSPPKRRTSRS